MVVEGMNILPREFCFGLKSR